MKSASLLVALTILAAACDSPLVTEDYQAHFSATTSTESIKEPFSMTQFVPCAAGGAGESVLLQGTLHVLLHLTEDSQGGFHAKAHFQPQGVHGYGLTTGDKYQATGVTQDQSSSTTNGASTFTFVNNFRIIGQGSGNNFLVHNNVHITLNANGELTAELDNFSADCR